jgi:integrase
MARRKKIDGARVLGPYADRESFRVIRVNKDGTREWKILPTRAEAEQLIREWSSEEHRTSVTICEALGQYEIYMREDKGNKPNSVKQTSLKLRRFFADVSVELSSLTPESCEQIYEDLRRSKRKPQPRKPPKKGKPPLPPQPVKSISVDYHRNTLSEAKTFLNWCVKRKWIATNPLMDVEGVGRRRHGKEQLRIDEARKWLAKATELAAKKDGDGAIAAMMTLLMGMRCSEVISRVVRDVDDDGKLLWIPDAKTEKGKRTLQIPEALRPYFAKLSGGKKPEALLFGHRDRAWPRNWVQKICEEAGVPIVTAHGQRGLHSTLAVEAGVTARAVADALGHESFTTTAQSYATPESVAKARQDRAMATLAGAPA